MKHLTIITLLIAFNVHAQDDNLPITDEASAKNQKRPSWSQGLPERQSSVNPSSSMNKLNINSDFIKTPNNDINFSDTELPNVEIDIVSTTPIMELEIEPVKHAILTREEAFDQYYSSDHEDKKDLSSKTVNPLIADYKWTPIKTLPINVTESFDTNEALKLNIQINPKGEVTRVTGVDNSIPRKVFKNAEKSILNWKFQAPEKVGITENISKTFTIDINTEA